MPFVDLFDEWKSLEYAIAWKEFYFTSIPPPNIDYKPEDGGLKSDAA